MATKKAGAGGWLKALENSGLQVKSARDALQVKGWLDTGNYALNWAISGRFLRGYPLGHTGELFGDPSTGKSLLVARAIAMAQQQGGHALLDDVENAYNAEHAASIGVDVDALAYCRSRTVKNHLDATLSFAKAFKGTGSPGPGVIACDSLSQLTTEHELDTKLEKKDMSKAGELKAFYRVVGGELFDLPVLHLATSHTIAAIGQYNTRTTSGGGGPKFTATFRIDLRAVTKIRDPQNKKEVIAVLCRAVVDKNRIVAPWKEVQFALPFHAPISRASGLVPLLVTLGILEERGNFLYHEGQKMGRAYKTKERFLAQDETGEQILDQFPELLEDADKAIAEGRVNRVGVPAPEQEGGDGDAEDDAE